MKSEKEVKERIAKLEEEKININPGRGYTFQRHKRNIEIYILEWVLDK